VARGRITFARAGVVASGFERGATTTTAHTAIGSTDNVPTAGTDSIPLTEVDLDWIIGAGGDLASVTLFALDGGDRL
jgi:hypothetical protein